MRIASISVRFDAFGYWDRLYLVNIPHRFRVVVTE